jgi:4-diphosphocytidyl-2-C-methyl-D-erythritol kinase
MVVFPNAKINLGLNVTERRADGYHNLETVFYPLVLSDILEVLPGGIFEFQTSGLPVDANKDDNLVVKAFQLLNRDFRLPPVAVYLHKVIPMGAGLGGGSSDAAFMLRALNNLSGLNLSDDHLKRYAVQLGADCAFFIENRPAVAAGIGDLLTPAEVDLSGYSIVLVKPPFPVNTAMAYRAITPGRARIPVAGVVRQPIETWKGLLVNDFEAPVFDLFPDIGDIKKRLYDSGAVYASMSGSGSAVYGIFNKVPDGLAGTFGADYFIFQQ